MSRRRRYSDDDESEYEGGRASKRRRGGEAEIEERLESLITRVGEKSTSSLESNLEGLAGVLEADLPNYKPKIIKILCICAVMQPEKITVYTTLAGLLNAKNPGTGGEFADLLFKFMKDYMKANEWEKARVIVRFLSDLGNCSVVDPVTILAMFESFITVTMEDDIPQVRSDWFVYAVLSSLPWIGGQLAAKKPEELNKMMDNIDRYLGNRKKDHLPMLRVWHSDSPHPQEDYLDSLWAQMQKLRKDNWITKCIRRPYLAFEGILGETALHPLPAFTPPPHTDESVYPVPKVVFRMFDYTDAPEGPTLPGHHSIERYLVEDQLQAIINSCHKERKECAAQLVSFHAKAQVPLNYMIAEVVFSEMFSLPQPPRIEIFHAAIFLELCKLQPSSLPQVLAQATEMLYERLDTMNLNCVDRLVNWFAHHLSNFQFRWSWDEWTDCLQMDPELPKPKFVREVLHKCMRLSYHQRIVESVPENFAPLLPRKPGPVNKFKMEDASKHTGCMESHRLIDAFKSKANAEEIISLMKEFFVTKDDDSMDDDTNPDELRIEVFTLTILYMGSKSFSHSFSALAKFHAAFKYLAKDEDSMIYLLRKLREVWQTHEQMIFVLVDKMLRTQIVTCPAVVNWIFSPYMAEDFTKLFTWEILHATLRKMSKHVVKIAKELENTKEKLAKKNKEDDSGEDDDFYAIAPSEAQVERLQESLETAQSEQKNLFLIIFQRFIMILTEHIVSCENRGAPFHTPWFNYSIQRLQQIFIVHYNQVTKYTSTLENLLFTSDTDPNILQVFQQFCSLRS
ncbi:nuclear cap-binding protein subunit 1-like [Amphiura filiformis]|uniref:nuclear cap-binding protein subunit 1-like n=1 Tax=Amphiura filiformis TaxID=82378 RepID=UPI003B21CB39